MARPKIPDNPRDFKGQTDDYILQVVTEDWNRSVSFCNPYFDLFQEFYRLYNCQFTDEEKRPNGANLFIPYIYNIVETSIPKLIGSILDSRPFISYMPQGGSDEQKGKNMTSLVDFQMRQYMRAATRFYEIFKTACLYGTAISKQGWRYETKNVTRRKNDVEQTVELGDGTPQKTKGQDIVVEPKVLYDAPEIKNIPLESFRFDPAYTDIDSSPFVGHEYWKEKHELTSEKGYRNTSKLSTEDQQDGELRDRLTLLQKNPANMKNGVRIWEYWTDDYKVLIANKTTVIQCIENPYYHHKKPFTKWTLIPMPNEWFGKPPIAALTDLQAELNTTRSQRIDNVSLALNRMYLVNRNASVDPKQLVSRPNGYVEVDDINNDIKELITQDVTGSAYKEEEIIKEDMDVTSGIHNYDRGQEGSRKETATVANLLTSASSERFKLQIMMMEEDPMADVGRQLAELNKQFLDDGTWIRVTQDGGDATAQQISLADIDAEFDIVAVGTAIEAAVNKELRQTQLIQLLSTSSNIEGVNMKELMRDIFKEFDFKNIDELITPDVPVDTGTAVDPNAEQAETPSGVAEPGGIYPQTGGVGGMGLGLEQPK